VHALARELYERLGTVGEHLDRLGRSLTGAVGSYNKAIASLETRVLVTARRLHELDVGHDDLESPHPIEEAVRPLSAAELLVHDPRAGVLPADTAAAAPSRRSG
jgi:DNA recombination protein RmuC